MRISIYKFLTFICFCLLHSLNLRAEIETGFYEGTFKTVFPFKYDEEDEENASIERDAYVFIRDYIEPTSNVKNYYAFIFIEGKGTLKSNHYEYPYSNSMAIFKVVELGGAKQAWLALTESPSNVLTIQTDLDKVVSYNGEIQKDDGDTLLQLTLNENTLKHAETVHVSGEFEKSSDWEWVDLTKESFPAIEMEDANDIQVSFDKARVSGDIFPGLEGAGKDFNLAEFIPGIYILKKEALALNNPSGTKMDNNIVGIVFPIYKDRCFLLGDRLDLCILSPPSNLRDNSGDWPFAVDLRVSHFRRYGNFHKEDIKR